MGDTVHVNRKINSSNFSFCLQIAKLARDLKKQLNVGFDSPSHMPPLASKGADSTATSASAAGLRTVTSAREGRLDSSG